MKDVSHDTRYRLASEDPSGHATVPIAVWLQTRGARAGGRRTGHTPRAASAADAAVSGMLDDAALLLLIALLFPVLILLVGMPVALLVRLVMAIAQLLERRAIAARGRRIADDNGPVTTIVPADRRHSRPHSRLDLSALARRSDPAGLPPVRRRSDEDRLGVGCTCDATRSSTVHTCSPAPGSTPSRRSSIEQPVRVCGIGAVFTAPDRRDGGHASALVERLLDQAARDGAEMALLFSDPDRVRRRAGRLRGHPDDRQRDQRDGIAALWRADDPGAGRRGTRPGGDRRDGTDSGSPVPVPSRSQSSR